MATTEYVLLLAIYAFMLVGFFTKGPISPYETFRNSGPRLGARIENHVEVGRGFNPPRARWTGPSGN